MGGLLLGLFARHLVDLGGSVHVGDGGGQLDVLATGSCVSAGLLVSVAFV